MLLTHPLQVDPSKNATFEFIESIWRDIATTFNSSSQVMLGGDEFWQVRGGADWPREDMQSDGTTAATACHSAAHIITPVPTLCAVLV